MVEQTMISGETVNGRTAAAILIAILETDQAAAIVSQLDSSDLEALAAVMLEMEEIGLGRMHAALEQFAALMATPQIEVGDATQRFGALVAPVLGEAGAERLIGHMAPPRGLPPVAALRWMAPEKIARIVLDEHAQAAALILARLDPAVSAQVLSHIPETRKVDLLWRVASLRRVSSDALTMMDAALSAISAAAPLGQAVELSGASLAARICGNVAGDERQRLLKAIAKADKSLAAGIEDEMLTFADLLLLDGKSLGSIIRAADDSMLTVALRGLSVPDRERVFSCLSARAADGLRDDLEDGEPVAMADVRAAQAAIVAIARRLSEAGTIRLSQADADYV